MGIPTSMRAGDTIKWRDAESTDVLGNVISSSSWTLTYFLRSNAASEALTVVGQAYGKGWELVISAATSAAFETGRWYWQAVASAGSEKATLGSGQFDVLPSLAYTGTAAAFDGRSQARKDLEACQAAIRSLMVGGAVQEYKIGNRNLRRFDLPDLIALESKLKADVVRAERAEKISAGLGDPHKMYVRFTR